MAQSISRNDSIGPLPGRPHKDTGTLLTGRVVLLPRVKEPDRIASAL